MVYVKVTKSLVKFNWIEGVTIVANLNIICLKRSFSFSYRKRWSIIVLCIKS